MFSLRAFTQGCVWNTWGPLAATSEPAFGWNDGVIALMSNWGPIAYLVGTPVLTWLMDVKGLRWACLLVGGCLLLGSGLRCITSTPPLATGLIHVGQFLNGLGGPLVQGGCPLVSAVWFPVYQRATATALGSMMGGLGVGLSFIIGPLLVPMPNTTSAFCNSSSENCHGNWSTTDIHDTRQDIMRLMYIEFGWTAVIFLAILVYFPARPPTPPSYSASHQRVDFKQGLKQLFKHRGFWMLGLPYALASGVFNCWGSVIDVVLKPLDISQDKAGWLGFYGTIAGNIAGLVIARFADLFSRHMKLFLIFLFSGATATFVVFCLTCIIESHPLYISDPLHHPDTGQCVCVRKCAPVLRTRL